jgi:hypothetical protein
MCQRDLPYKAVAVGGGGPRWSLGRRFTDQDAILTLVEVKRSTNIRIYRVVVGQMLDCAANIPAH